MQEIIIKWVLAHSLWFFTPEQITGWVSLFTDAVDSGRKCTDPTTSAGNSVLTGHLIPVHFFFFFFPRKNNPRSAPITNSGAFNRARIFFVLIWPELALNSIHTVNVLSMESNTAGT